VSSDLFNRMMESNRLTNEEFKAKREADIERKRHEMAGTMTRMMVNEALQRVKQTKEENEALAKARAEKQ
jgi:hypothetical protein